ncbi:MAG TPA: ATP-binding protein [bacterium]|nr:ATP-binding protein [bacterium]
MERFLSQQLVLWKNEKERKPLILRGARQVGKSYLVRELGRSFSNFIEINFEMEPYLADIFSNSLDPKIIIEKLSIARNITITPGETLLFFDEIQKVPNAITALRYFYELLPELHIIAAGSLFDFVLEKIGMPVGRVSSMYVYPLSFKEFIIATGKEKLCGFIDRHNPEIPLDDLFFSQLTTLFSEYMAIGGMPEAVRSWLENRDLKKVRKIHNDIIDTYRQDFIKYAKNQQIHHVEKVFSVIPRMLGKKFIYSHIDESLKSREIKPALELLEMAGIIHRIRHSSSNGVPLEAESNDTIFKTIFLDIGLSQSLLGLSDGEWILNIKNSVINKGALVESFVGQEILAYSSPDSKKKLYYWVREKTSAQAEIDYVIEKDSTVIPVEVKSGTTGTLKSLIQFIKEKESVKYGIQVSLKNFGSERNIRQIPLCALWKIF